MYAAGQNTSGECTVPVAAQSGVSAIDAAFNVSFALKSGAVLAWGSSAYSLTTVPVAAQTGVTQISAALNHILCIKGNNVIGWGSNGGGQLNIPSALTDNTAGLTQVVAGSGASLALKNGRVYGWGGWLDSTTIPSNLLTGVSQIGMWFDNTAFALKSGTVYAFGSNTNLDAAFLSGVTAISKFGPNFAALKGTAGWYLASGGARTGADLNASGLTCFAGYSAGCFIKNGELWLNGLNDYGQSNFDY